MIKRLLLPSALAAAWLSSCLFVAPAQAQLVSAETVTACGTANHSPPSGIPAPITQDPTGHLCTNATGGGGGPATLAAGSVASGAYLSGSLAAGAIVDLGTGGSPATNTVNSRLATLNTTLGSPFQAGGSIGNTAFGISGTLPAYAAIPTFKIDQTTPGSTNAVAAISGGFVDCAITTIGCEADSPWTSGNGTIAAMIKALATNATPVPTTATAQTSKVICASACSLKSFEVMADSTLSGAAWEILILNATSDPGNGAVTPIKCYQFAAGQVSGFTKEFPTPINFSTGATIVVSTGTTCFTEAQSSHATFIEGDY